MRFRQLLGAKAAQQPNDPSVVRFNRSCDVNTANKPTENEIKLKSRLALVSSYKVCVAVAWKANGSFHPAEWSPKTKTMNRQSMS